MKIIRKTVSFFIAILLFSALCLTAYAYEIEPFYTNGKIISVAHLGNTMDYPANSLEAIISAFEKGADCVSVSAKMSSDGALVLSESDNLGAVSLEGAGMLISSLPLSQIEQLHLTDKFGRLSQYTLTTLDSALKSATEADRILIIDSDWDLREEIYKCICDNEAISNAFIRTSAPKKEIQKFIDITSSMCDIVGEYHGNILFSARSYITALSNTGSKMVFLGTKNSFGSIFRTGVLSAFSKTNYTTRAAMKVYDTKESGARADCEASWGDIIDRGYSVIETDRIADLVTYINKLENERVSLQTLLSQAETTETVFLTAQSTKELETAIADARSALTTISSFEKLSLEKSRLNHALTTKVLTDSPESGNEGVFKITIGRIIAIILVTAAIIAVQIYFYYRRADKKKPAWLSFKHK